ncbi:hypothetical protein [Nitrosomonas sp.]|uniref:hypothetical protein n=1 Tax=Nitrosomonas sp. TaxID=42353 RepID=UPI0025EC2EA2|nr:hypothetical protein [Nitrosomonas sp.]
MQNAQFLNHLTLITFPDAVIANINVSECLMARNKADKIDDRTVTQSGLSVAGK